VVLAPLSITSQADCALFFFLMSRGASGKAMALLEFEERLFEQVDADMVEERGEPLLLPFPRHFPYAFQRL
jgi:hypothetical protein